MTEPSYPSRILKRVVLGERFERTPIWIMRQAGRYLPEYREVRKEAGSFLDLCFRPDLATEVTLQPLRRFDLDAAILFSDILIAPMALGRRVWFVEGEGPRLDPIESEEVDQICATREMGVFEPVLEAVKSIRSQLDQNKTLIGFCGSPWTVLTYMIGGRGSSDQAKARLFALQHPKAFEKLVDALVEVSTNYLIAQLQAGADVVQLFESWASNMDELSYRKWVIEPNQRIVAGIRAQVPDAAIIGFPRGAAALLDKYVAQTEVNMVGIDYATPLHAVQQILPDSFGVQGNLDPLRVVAGGEQMKDRAQEILAAFADRPHVFNLGHGIVPQTPIEHVQGLIEAVRSAERQK